jgi:hypothetical protein
MKRAVVLGLALLAGEARASDGGVEGEGLVLEVRSGVVTLPSGAVRSVDAGVYLDETAAVRAARELASARAELVARRMVPVQAVTPGYVTLLAALSLVGGLVLGLWLRGLW